MKRSVICIALVLSLAPLAGCGKKSESAPVAVKPPVAVEAEIAKAAELVQGIEVTGSLEPKSATDVKTQIPGLVKEVYVTEWVRVRKGQPLARIDVSETQALVQRAEASIAAAKAGLAQARAGQSRAERELARLLKLKEAGLATQQALDDARTEQEAAAARVESSRAQISVAEEELRQARAKLRKGSVTAPIDGVIALKSVNVGDLASDAAAAAPIFRIVDNRLLNLTVTVPSADSARVKPGQKLEFAVDSLPGQTFSAAVKYVNPELSAADRSLKVIAEYPNVPETLKGGLFAKGRIVTGSRKGVVMIPRSSLASWDTAARTAVLKVVEKDLARLRSVQTGEVSGDLVEIATGLKEGEKFVVRGGFNVKDGDRVVVSSPAVPAVPAVPAAVQGKGTGTSGASPLSAASAENKQ